MSKWSLSTVLSTVHNDVQQQLTNVRESVGHPSTKGDASESVWIKLLNEYLPRRYFTCKAHVVDSNGQFSDQIDVLIIDRQYSPFMFSYAGQCVVPAESVYAVFEAKQSVTAPTVGYAKRKVASVRSLHRTSLPIPTADGVLPPKKQIRILGGVLSCDSGWSPAMGQSFQKSLLTDSPNELLNLGCVASGGYFRWIHDDNRHDLVEGGKPATAFLFELISQLQESGTVPMIDVNAYAQWLK